MSKMKPKGKELTTAENIKRIAGIKIKVEHTISRMKNVVWLKNYFDAINSVSKIW